MCFTLNVDNEISIHLGHSETKFQRKSRKNVHLEPCVCAHVCMCARKHACVCVSLRTEAGKIDSILGTIMNCVINRHFIVHDICLQGFLCNPHMWD